MPVRRLQADPFALGVKALERCIFVYQRNYHVAGVGRVALLNDNEVAVMNSLLDHGLAYYPENEVLTVGASNQRRRDDEGLSILYRLYRLACGDSTQKGQLSKGGRPGVRAGRQLYSSFLIPISAEKPLRLE